MDGEIWVQSAPGQGSTFGFTARFGTHDGLPRRAPPAVDLRGLRCLVVDDNATNRFIVRGMLADTGAALVEVAGAEQGIAELRRAGAAGEPYQLVLLDGRMPEVDGFQAAAVISRDPDLGEPIVMMLTSERRMGDIERCRELGIACHLVKPIKRVELFEAIAAALGGAARTLDLPPTTTVPAPVRPLRILVAEDTLDNRILLQLYLRDSPHHVEMVENGQLAVERFAAGAYDIILMDVQMPVLDGHAATRAIRARERAEGRPPVPIIALTAYALREEIEKSLAAGCSAHLVKPMRKAALLQAIAAAAQATHADEILSSQETLRLRPPFPIRPAPPTQQPGPTPSEPVPVGGGAGAGGEVDAPIVVVVDPELADLIPEYLARRRQDLARMRAALEAGDFETVRTLGHAMKGSGGAYGFTDITALGSRLEQVAKAPDVDATRAALDDLARYLARVQVTGGSQEPLALHG